MRPQAVDAPVRKFAIAGVLRKECEVGITTGALPEPGGGGEAATRSGYGGGSRRQLQPPSDAASDRAGNIYVADVFGNARVVKLEAHGKFLKSWDARGTQPGPAAFDCDQPEGQHTSRVAAASARGKSSQRALWPASPSPGSTASWAYRACGPVADAKGNCATVQRCNCARYGVLSRADLPPQLIEETISFEPTIKPLTVALIVFPELAASVHFFLFLTASWARSFPTMSKRMVRPS